MPMKFGLSLFGALQTPDDTLRLLTYRSFVDAEISVWRVFLLWTPPGEQFSLITPDGGLRQQLLSRLVNLMNFADDYNIHFQLVGLPNFVGRSNYNRYKQTWSDILTAIGPLPSSTWSVDLWNEQDQRDNQEIDDGFPMTKALYDITREKAPGHKITVSLSLSGPANSGPPWQSRPDYQYVRWQLLAQKGINLDYYASHAQRNPPDDWAEHNKDHFDRLRKNFTTPGNTLYKPNPELWDDEGARERYSENGRPVPDPTVQERVDAAQGAEDAGCYVHIFHTDANFYGGLGFSQTELEAIGRISREVIDDVEVEPPPGPEPEPTPEPC